MLEAGEVQRRGWASNCTSNYLVRKLIYKRCPNKLFHYNKLFKKKEVVYPMPHSRLIGANIQCVCVIMSRISKIYLKFIS